MIDSIIFVFFVFGVVCFYFGLISLAYYPLALAYPLWERRLLRRARREGFSPRVSVLVAAYNEEQTIAHSLSSILASDYPDFEVIVVNDGSTDNTREAVASLTQDVRLRYIEKANGGKASALNRGLQEAAGDIVLFTDADSIFEPDTIRNGVVYFIDPGIGAISGNDTPLHPAGALQKMLVITSHIGTGFVRRALSILGVLPIISGNLGLVRTETLRRIGGFRELWGEDLELTVRLHREGVRVVYGSATRVLAECPSTIAGLWKQRVRWIRSYIKVLRLHRDMIGNLRYGPFGLFLVFNAFNMVAIPVLHMGAMLLLPFAAAYGSFYLYGWEWVAYLGWGLLLAAATVAILLDRAPRDFRYLPYGALLIFFSHFYNAVVLYSIWAEIKGSAEAWNKLDRRDPTQAAQAGRPRYGAILAAGLALVVFGLGYWLGTREKGQPFESIVSQPLMDQPGVAAAAIHFEAWGDWRDAYKSLLAVPESRYLNHVGVSAGRVDWTFFQWPRMQQWWSPVQRRNKEDMLETTIAALRERGYGTTAILDIFAARYLQRYPEDAAVSDEGKRSKEIVCSTVLAHGRFGQHVFAATEALAASTSADAIALTELFYDHQCYDDRCLEDFRRVTGERDWPRTASGDIDRFDARIGKWRSGQIASIISPLSRAIHRQGKKFLLDVRVSWDDLTRNSAENGQDYQMMAPYVDEFVVWDYFALQDIPPEVSAKVAAYFEDEFGPDRFFLSVGLWDNWGYIDAQEFARALNSARTGGAAKVWVTPAGEMKKDHWRALAGWVEQGVEGAAGSGTDLTPQEGQGARLNLK